MSYKDTIKPLFDFIVGFIVLLLFLPLLLIVIAFLFVVNDGKVWFVQPRPGKHGRIFRIIKFKTMKDAFDLSGAPLPDDQRLTTIGKVVRKTSIDELPQLINVLKGEMSIIGPRPLLVEYLDYYNDVQSRRHEVRPGITGWAQINGRNAISWHQKFEYDVWYVDNISFTLDLKIIILTVFKVFKTKDVNSATSVTMEKFKGNG